MGLIEKIATSYLLQKITAPRLKEFLDTAHTVQKEFFFTASFSIFIKIKIEFLSQNKSNIKSYYI